MVKLSLILCTRNRADKLSNCLRFVEEMDKPESFELIVVDNGSTDSTQEVISQFVNKATFELRVIIEKRKGVSHAKNYGLKLARGELVAFTDDDCYVDKNYARSIILIFDKYSHISFLGGRIVLHDEDDLRMTILESMEEKAFPPFSFIQTGEIQGANFAFRRSALNLVGGFDTLLGPGTPFTSEDIDVVTRLSAHGYAGLYSPLPVVRHHHGRRSVRDRKALNHAYDRGRGAYVLKALFFSSLWPKAALCWLRSLPAQSLGRFAFESFGAVGYAFLFIAKKLWNCLERES